MPNLPAYHEVMARSDAGYGLLFVCALLVLALGWYLWRFEQRRRALLMAGAGFYTASLFLLSPIAVGVAGLAFMIGRRLRWPSPARLPLVVYPLVLGLVLRLPRLFDTLWYDETFTAALARLPFDRLAPAILGDVHPPLNYLISWLLARVLGTSEMALRLPALGFGLLLIWLIYRLALALRLSDRVALVAALIVAALPAAIFYSNEARQYALLACLAAGLVVAVLESRWRWVVICGALLPWTHNIGLVYLAVIGGAGLLLYPSRRLLFSLVAAGLVAAAWLPFMLAQSGDVANGFWLHPLSLAGALWPVVDMTLTSRLAEPFVIHTYAPVMALTVAALLFARRWLVTRPGLLVLALVVGVPVAVALVSVFWRPVYLTRALLPCALGLSLLWARVLVESPQRVLSRLALGVVLVVALVGFFMPDAGKPPLKTYFQSCAGADSVYVANTALYFVASYYLPDLPLYVLPGSDDLNQTLPSSAKAALAFHEVASIAPGRSACLLLLDSPMTTPAQRARYAAALARYPHAGAENVINNVFHLSVFKVTT